MDGNQYDIEALTGLVVRPFYFEQPTTPWKVLYLIQEIMRVCWENPATEGIIVRAPTGRVIQPDDTPWGGYVTLHVDTTMDVSHPVKWKLIVQALLKMTEIATKDGRWESFTAAFYYNDMRFGKLLVNAATLGVMANQTTAFS